VASNDPAFFRGLVVEDKWKRVKNYQEQNVKEFCELLAAAGCSNLNELNRKLIYKKIDNVTRSYEEWYPTVT
jgi:glutamate synthase domain-containing protein 2